MTNEEAIKLINTMILAMCLSDPNIAIGEVEEVKTALNMAIKALENQTSEDLISRKAVLDLAKDLTFEGGCKHRCVDVIKIYELPSYNSIKTELNEDLISRTELLNKIWQKEYGIDYDGVNLLNIKHIDIIENMPSIKNK